jgi:uncharacterized protein
MTMLLSFVFMLLVVASMAIGVMFGRKPIAGSCGGMKALGMNVQCEICGGDPNACENNESAGRQVRSGDPQGLAREAVRGKPREAVRGKRTL